MTKISELTSIVTAAATDIIAVVQGGVTKQVTVQDYRNAGIIPDSDQMTALAAYEAALAAAEADQVLTASGPGEAAFAAAAGGGAVDSVNGQTGAVVLDAADVGAQSIENYQMKVFYIGGANPASASDIDTSFQGFVGRAPNANPAKPDLVHYVDFGSANTIYLLSKLGSAWYGINMKTGAAVSFL